jgi:cytochrome c5
MTLKMIKLSTLAAISSVALLISVNAYSNHNTQESMEARVSAVGELNVSDEASVSSSEESAVVDGASVYNTSCAACHGSGVAGAPIVGEVDDWEDRIEQGFEVLVEHAIQGFQGSVGVMPAKGGNPSLSDESVTAAVQYMVDQVQ